jgi:aspartyl-tRNA synthetase
MLKTRNCGELRPQHDGEHVVLAGWVNRRRDLGGAIFIDLRDRWGITQIVTNADEQTESHEVASEVRTEYVIQVVGRVRIRPEGTANPDLETGEIEVVADQITILNDAKTPPFYINKDEKIDESVRMKYRYLDLRRPNMQRNLILRHRVVKFIRDYLDERGFLEIETPILFKTTPEGARDFLVPSRLLPGTFYALPQSPQQLKQLLMVGGYERYFQIARCFRDEDLRGNRQPEFTQLDLEMSFVQRDDIMELIEGLMIALVENVVPDKHLKFKPFPRIKYNDAMEKYGSDKPDLRYGVEAVDISELAARASFDPFKQNVTEGKPVKVLCAPGMGAKSGTALRKQAEDLEAMAKSAGAKGLGWMALAEEADGEPKGPMAKYFTDVQAELVAATNAQPGDLLLFISDVRDTVYVVVDTLRRHIAKELNLADPDELAFAWIIDFPMFYWNEEEQRWDPSQHLFTSPLPEDIPLLDTDPGAARGSQYDLAGNGQEIAGGSIRIHSRELQEKIFPLIGMTMEKAREQFGHMLEAFEYGTPPHGGIASGIDRLIMTFSGETNIRDVMAFPKTQTGSDLMAGAPSEADPKQLAELNIKLTIEPEKQS